MLDVLRKRKRSWLVLLLLGVGVLAFVMVGVGPQGGQDQVVRGALRYHVGPPVRRSFRVDSTRSAVVVPELRHRVEAEGPVRFFIEFSRVRQGPAAARSRAR